jgi:truncated hemoglobin YjbI
MRDAVTGLGLPEHLDALLWDYLTNAAHSLVNTFE